MIHGRFDKFSGKFSIDRAAKTGNVELVVETASVDTNDNDKGTASVPATSTCARPTSSTPRNFPEMTYKSTNVVFAGDVPTTVEGTLTLLGVTKPVSIKLERFKCNPATATAKERCGGDRQRQDQALRFRHEGEFHRSVTSSSGLRFEGDKD